MCKVSNEKFIFEFGNYEYWNKLFHIWLNKSYCHKCEMQKKSIIEM